MATIRRTRNDYNYNMTTGITQASGKVTMPLISQCYPDAGKRKNTNSEQHHAYKDIRPSDYQPTTEIGLFHVS